LERIIINEYRAEQAGKGSFSPMERPNWLHEGIAYLTTIEAQEIEERRNSVKQSSNGIRIIS
jgi:hypothetical protein